MQAYQSSSITARSLCVLSAAKKHQMKKQRISTTVKAQEFIATDKAPAAAGPYSQGIKVRIKRLDWRFLLASSSFVFFSSHSYSLFSSLSFLVWRPPLHVRLRRVRPGNHGNRRRWHRSRNETSVDEHGRDFESRRFWLFQGCQDDHLHHEHGGFPQSERYLQRILQHPGTGEIYGWRRVFAKRWFNWNRCHRGVLNETRLRTENDEIRATERFFLRTRRSKGGLRKSQKDGRRRQNQQFNINIANT